MSPKSVNPVKSVTVGQPDRVRSTRKKVGQGTPPEGGFLTDLLRLRLDRVRGSRGRSTDLTDFAEVLP